MSTCYYKSTTEVLIKCVYCNYWLCDHYLYLAKELEDYKEQLQDIMLKRMILLLI